MFEGLHIRKLIEKANLNVKCLDPRTDTNEIKKLITEIKDMCDERDGKGGVQPDYVKYSFENCKCIVVDIHSLSLSS